MLSIKNLSAGYAPDTFALRDFSLNVEAGQIAAVMGPNGCGKSTLLRCICGLLEPRDGSVLLDECDIARMPPRKRAQNIAMLPQSLENGGELLVEEMVALGRTPHLSPYGAIGPRDREVVERALASTSTLSLRGRAVGELSGGERQRVALARALAQEPRVMLLDEPTSNLDLRFQYEVLQRVFDLARSEKLIVILVLHQINLAAAVADVMALLGEDGSTQSVGPPDAVMTQENLERVYHVPLRVNPHPVSGRPQAAAQWSFE